MLKTRKILLLVAFGLLCLPLSGCTQKRLPNNNNTLRPLQVGVLVSHFHSTGPHWTSKSYGYETTRKMINELDRDDFNLHAVIEPDTKHEESIRDLLALSVFSERIVDGSDANALGELDVLVIPRTPNTLPEVTGAILVAQGGGLSLIKSAAYGSVTPTFADHYVNRLHGITQGAYFWFPKPSPAVVVKSHPILGNLQPGDSVLVKPNGIGGNLGNADVLVEMSPDFDRGFGPGPTANAEPYSQPVIFVSRVGAGRVLQTNWRKQKPSQLPDEFFSNAVRWIANRPLRAPVDLE